MESTCEVMSKLFQSDPNVISFGIGSPAKEALPVDILREIAEDVLRTDRRGIEALAYGAPMGARDLREVVVDHLLVPKGIRTDADHVMITSGGMETIDLACQLFINPGDVILVESPSFIHSIMTFQMFEAVCVPCEMDDHGLVMEDVERKIQAHHPKMIYTVPTFQNPTGVTMALDRRRRLAELASQYDVAVLEDDPYRDIRYSGEELLPIKAFDKTGHVVLANSFSKIFSPGSRLGYIVAEERAIAKMADAKTATNSHTSMIAQVLCAEFFKRGYFPEHLSRIRELYRVRRDTMVACIDRFFPQSTKYAYPDGGLFTWVELPGGINTTALLEEAKRTCGISFVAGEGFYIEPGKGKSCMRLSFGGVEEETIRMGLERLGGLICAKL